ncbi:MAG: hypothetical protein MUE92_00440 [Chloroflexi bacterium]|nr:hypothetical protein [Chloroflexota bacterium]MCU0562357.1 hypothetical protein [Desulfobacterales bacterium]
MTKVVFGEADPRLFALPESASEQTKAASVTFIRPVALRATLELRLVRYARKRCDSCGVRRVRYAITLNGNPVTGTICARCAGVR